MLLLWGFTLSDLASHPFPQERVKSGAPRFIRVI